MQLIVVMLLCVVVIFANTGTAAALWYPSSITALGDSITTAYDSTKLGSVPANSWSTGTNSSVNSMYLRILAVNSLINRKNVNLAVPGAKVADLNSQASQVGRKVDYVTVLIGANDVCTSSEATMTDLTTFQAQFAAAMQTLTERAPKAKIYVLSIPNIYNLWYILKDNSSARAAWSLFNVCQSMLANPMSMAQADIDRRNAVNQREVDFNTQLQAVCALYPQCTFDNNAVFNTAFVVSDVSTIDYFHPSLAGQTKLASVAWNASILVTQ